MNFVVDDIVKGISDNYCITDMDMTRGRILSVHGDEIEVRVMSHKSNPFCLGASYVVEAQYFEKIGHIKPFNREEVLELIAKGNQNKLNEYDFYGADLSGANLRSANLSGANLRSANLSGADLSGANLRSANLSGANLRSANLSGANLRSANLRSADLRSADLSGANLRSANLRSADLSGANLRSANLSGADLSGANLRSADLSGANLLNVRYDECTGFFALVCPEEGSFIGYKKANGHIVKLRITEDALRSSATSRKCRCSKAEVLSITTLDGEDDGLTSIPSNYDSNFIYRVGTTVEVEDFETDRWDECAAGIHFFITRQEAVQY
ncbi:MAG: pentapeptide repeat-containing protein [Intestinibacter bartlettii]|nr:pentapeptide repeat-containing protein [Intestinibacter bartlettii]